MTIAIQRSFAGGEISPYLYARIDQVKYQSGLTTCRNMMVLRHGGAQSRPGTTFVGEVKNSASGPIRTVKFVFNASQTYHLEFGELYVRFAQNGQQVVEGVLPITGISQANPAVISIPNHGYSNGQEIFVSGVSGMTQINGRNLIVQNVTTNTFTVQNKDGSNVNSLAWSAWTSGGTAARIYELATPYAQSDVPLLEYAQSGDEILICHASYPPQILSRFGNTSWTIAPASFAPMMVAPTSPHVTDGDAGSEDGYVITAISAATGEESLPTSPVVSSETASGSTPLTVSWTAAVGASFYNIYKNSNGVYGFVGIAGLDGVTMSFVDNGVTADTTNTPPAVNNPFVGSAIWGTTGSMSGAREGHFSIVLQNGKVLVGGGKSNVGVPNTQLATCELYDPSTGIWTPASSMANPRANMTATLLQNGKVLVSGGQTNAVGETASCEIYDPAAGTWSATGSLVAARQTHTATILQNGNVLVAGGVGIGGGAISSCEIFNSITGTWALTGSLSTGRNNHASVLLSNGNVLSTGGANAAGGVLSSCELYAVLTGIWSTVGAMSVTKQLHTLTILPTGNAIAIGGVSGAGIDLVTAEIYNTVSQTWSATGSLAVGRYSHVTVAFNDGQIIVSGGNAGSAVLPSATATSELYSELSGIFTSGGSMAVGVISAAASLLPSGAVLVSGGSPSGVSPASLTACGLYTPVEGNYPATVAFYQQRLMLANSNNNPQGVNGSRTGNFYNFTTSTPVEDDQAVSFTMASTQVQAVRHMADLGELIIFTAAGEFSVSGDANGSLTPAAVNLRQHSYCGSNQLRPLIVGSNAIFVQARGGVVRDLQWDWQVNGYRGNDLTLFSTHLFDGHQLVDWDYAQIPNYIVWAARDDGMLLGMTYIHEQQIFGWHRHDLSGGFVENVLSIPEGQADAVYLVVRRVINGRTVRYIERMSNRFIAPEVTGQLPLQIASFVGMDATLSFNGWNSGPISMTLGVSPTTGTWLYTDNLPLVASGAYFTSAMVGNQIFLVVNGDMMRCTINSVTSPTAAVVSPDKTVPATYQNTPITYWAYALKTITGLFHLEGQELSVLADGLVVSSPNNSRVTFTSTVLNGSVTLDRAYAVINAGLPFTCDVETLDLDTQQGETMADKAKLVSQVNVYVAQTRGIFAGGRDPGSDFDGSIDPLDALTEYKVRGLAGENYNDPISLRTGLVEINVEPSFTRNGHVFIRQVDPLPMTILAIAPAGFIPTKGAING